MPISTQRIAVFFIVLLMASSLSGCGTINGYLASGLGDYFPKWLGGLPADAPPRPGSVKYDQYMEERERKRLEPASPKETDKTSSSSLDPVH
jgi:hypothetical protein